MGSAVREVKCQVLSNCGGAVVGISTLTKVGNESTRTIAGVNDPGNTFGDGSVRRNCSSRN